MPDDPTAPPPAVPPPIPPAPRRSPSWLASPSGKLGTVLVLVLLLQLPLLAVSNLIAERQDRQEEVLAGIRRSWGPAQAVSGPGLVVPYTWVEPGSAGVPAVRRRGWVVVPARTLSVSATLAPETRQRGLFHATVYTAAVDLRARIEVPPVELPDIPGAVLAWTEAAVAVGASDLRGQPADGTMTVDGRVLRMAVTGAGEGCGAEAQVPAGLSGPPAPGQALTVATRLRLRGTQSFAVRPTAGSIDMEVDAPWPAPSFTGAALPLSHTIGADGFRARWEVTGDPADTGWATRGSRTGCVPPAAADTDVGVGLLDAVPTYLMVTRASKYATLFLVLSFLTYFLIEQGAGVRIHLAQYALLGLSVSLFALLLLAVAEPLGFTAGYAVATAAVLAQASAFTLSVTGRARPALLFATVLGTLFGLLYVILRLETFALLAGTTVLFAILSVVMVVTRRLNWSGSGDGGGGGAGTA